MGDNAGDNGAVAPVEAQNEAECLNCHRPMPRAQGRVCYTCLWEMSAEKIGGLVRREEERERREADREILAARRAGLASVLGRTGSLGGGTEEPAPTVPEAESLTRWQAVRIVVCTALAGILAPLGLFVGIGWLVRWISGAGGALLLGLLLAASSPAAQVVSTSWGESCRAPSCELAPTLDAYQFGGDPVPGGGYLLRIGEVHGPVLRVVLVSGFTRLDSSLPGSTCRLYVAPWASCDQRIGVLIPVSIPADPQLRGVEVMHQAVGWTTGGEVFASPGCGVRVR